MLPPAPQVLIGIPIGFLFVVFFFAFTGSRRERREKEIKDVRNRHFGRAKDGYAAPSMLSNCFLVLPRTRL
jgi:hypothetical protein